MTALASLDDAAKALEYQERIDDIRNALDLWARRGEIAIDVNFSGMSGRISHEHVAFDDCRGIKTLLTDYFNGIIAELEADIRKLGFEPTKG
jgi:hypothetical protein